MSVLGWGGGGGGGGGGSFQNGSNSSDPGNRAFGFDHGWPGSSEPTSKKYIHLLRCVLYCATPNRGMLLDLR